jgi:hypothetical protein
MWRKEKKPSRQLSPASGKSDNPLRPGMLTFMPDAE